MRRPLVAMVQGPADPRHDGVADYVHHLVPTLADAGVDGVPVVLGPSAGDGGEAAWGRATAAAAHDVRETQPDIVHVQFAPSAFRYARAPLLLPALLPCAVPLVTTVHEYGWWSAVPRVPAAWWSRLESSGRLDRETGLLVPASAAVLTSNPAHADVVAARTGRPVTVVPIAPNVAVHPDPDARSRVRTLLGLPADAVIVVFFGFVHPVKGLRYVIEALPALRDRYGEVHLLVVGGFTSQALPEPEARAFRHELLERAGDMAISAHLTVTGHLDDAAVSRLLQASDVGVLPFTSGVTTKSGALLALLAHGVPTAATTADEPDPQLVPDESVVPIARRRDATAVADALDRLLADPGLRERVRAGGSAVAARHTWPLVAQAHADVYRRVLADAR